MQTFFMLKPDAVARGLENEIFSRVEKSGLKVKEKRLIHMSREEAENLYSVHAGKPFFEGLVKMIISAPVVVSLIQGDNVINKIRQLMGATDPRKAEKGTIRGDLKEEQILDINGTIKNLVHGSDSEESFLRESVIFFKE